MTDKFRIFIKGQFYYYGWIENAGLSWVSPPTQGDISPQEVKEKSEVCLGLTDKTGKEIFVGDIVRIYCYAGRHPREAYSPTSWGLGYITYNSTYALFEIKNNIDKEYDNFRITAHPVEIISNIHQHPEVLEGKSI